MYFVWEEVPVLHYVWWNVRVYFDKNLYTIFAGEQ